MTKHKSQDQSTKKPDPPADMIPGGRGGYIKPPWTSETAPRNHTAGAVFSLMARVRKATRDGEDIIPVLKDALKHKNYAIKLKACEILLERGWGKAMQPVLVDAGSGVLDLTKLTNEELDALSKLIAKIAGNDEPKIIDVPPGEVKS